MAKWVRTPVGKFISYRSGILSRLKWASVSTRWESWSSTRPPPEPLRTCTLVAGLGIGQPECRNYVSQLILPLLSDEKSWFGGWIGEIHWVSGWVAYPQHWWKMMKTLWTLQDGIMKEKSLGTSNKKEGWSEDGGWFEVAMCLGMIGLIYFLHVPPFYPFASKLLGIRLSLKSTCLI